MRANPRERGPIVVAYLQYPQHLCRRCCRKDLLLTSWKHPCSNLRSQKASLPSVPLKTLVPLRVLLGDMIISKRSNRRRAHRRTIPPHRTHHWGSVRSRSQHRQKRCRPSQRRVHLFQEHHCCQQTRLPPLPLQTQYRPSCLHQGCRRCHPRRLDWTQDSKDSGPCSDLSRARKDFDRFQSCCSWS
jgi:hypothetical protein